MTPKIKLVCGFRKDQTYSIDGEEAHKAYYLFMHPEARGIFSNGLAIVGSHIQSVEPDWNATMGWNPTFTLGDDDWNEIRSSGAEKLVRGLMEQSKLLAQNIKPEELNTPMSELLETHGMEQKRLQ